MEFFREDISPRLIDVTYEWRVERYHTILFDKSKVSDTFVIGKDSYTLELFNNSPKNGLSLKLVQAKPREPSSTFLCSTGLVDRHGKLRHFVRKEAKLGKGCEAKELLSIPLAVLTEEISDLIREDALYFQLTINLPTEHEWLTPSDDCGRGLASLSRDMAKLLEDKTGADVVFKVGDTVFKVHRLILSARSPVFAQMFASSSLEGRSEDPFDIKDVECSIFAHVLRYIYTDQIDGGLTRNNVHKIIETAERYCLPVLKNSCVNFLATNLAIVNVCEAILLVEKFGDKRLEKAVHEFVCKNASEILRSEQWKKFKDKYTTIANSVLSSILVSKKSTQIE